MMVMEKKSETFSLLYVFVCVCMCLCVCVSVLKSQFSTIETKHKTYQHKKIMEIIVNVYIDRRSIEPFGCPWSLHVAMTVDRSTDERTKNRAQ